MTTMLAAAYGHLDCLRYAVENGCPINSENIIHMSEKYPEIIDYLTNLLES